MRLWGLRGSSCESNLPESGHCARSARSAESSGKPPFVTRVVVARDLVGSLLTLLVQDAGAARLVRSGWCGPAFATSPPAFGNFIWKLPFRSVTGRFLQPHAAVNSRMRLVVRDG